MGLDVLYCDVDSAWLEDPFQYLTDTRYSRARLCWHSHLSSTGAVQIQSDAASESEAPDSMLCTGFMLLKSDPVAMDLVTDWHVRTLGRPCNSHFLAGGNDGEKGPRRQPVHLQRHCAVWSRCVQLQLTRRSRYRAERPSFVLNVLRQDKFPSGACIASPFAAHITPGSLFFFDKAWREKQTAGPAVVHCNFIIGHFTKRAHMVVRGLWKTRL